MTTSREVRKWTLGRRPHCEAAVAIEMGADAADIALTIHPHPTLV